ncbi:Hypothetical_protein [Hexamita inflata]|uniref:Hypothetical_protein n=1 Tax=Hexamita inflata TaxID=28002 RepID=A0AA86QZA2_9EUKA|nr:Hypothetical protein HINF_LOCUS54433 [Hexamita inflata]CAI9966805.1 Hypothetical protein HINF_LOCUS54450 [Hexamita inflata]
MYIQCTDAVFLYLFGNNQAARMIIIKIVSWPRFSLFRVQLNVLTHYLYVTRALYSTSTNERTKATRRYQAAVNASGALRSSQDFPNTGVKQFYIKPQHSFARILFKMKQHCAILTAQARKQLHALLNPRSSLFTSPWRQLITTISTRGSLHICDVESHLLNRLYYSSTSKMNAGRVKYLSTLQVEV